MDAGKNRREGCSCSLFVFAVARPFRESSGKKTIRAFDVRVRGREALLGNERARDDQGRRYLYFFSVFVVARPFREMSGHKTIKAWVFVFAVRVRGPEAISGNDLTQSSQGLG